MRPSMGMELARSQLLMRQGRYEEAVAELGTLLAVDPSNSIALCGLAYGLLRSGKWNEALQVSDSALGLDPEHSQTHSIRGLILLERERYPEAEESL